MARLARAAAKAGRQLERAAQQILGIDEAAEPRRQLGHHPDRGDVGRLRLEARPQDVLGDGQVVVDQGLGGAHQLGIADRGGDRVELGPLGRLVVAGPPQRRAEQPQGVGIAGRGAQDLARLQRPRGRGVLAQQPRRQPQRLVHRSGRFGRHGEQPRGAASGRQARPFPLPVTVTELSLPAPILSRP